MNIYRDNKLGYENIIIDDDLNHENDERNYEIKMMTDNKISVFLDCNKITEDNKEKYIYNVQSMLSLRQLSSHSHLAYLELSILINTISKCREEIDKYLLSKKGLLLDPEYIFLNRNEKTLRFIFYPYNDVEVHEEYMKLAEFLLNAVNYEDEDAVKLVYELYASILNKDYELNKYIDEKIVSKYTEDTQNLSGEILEDTREHQYNSYIEKNRLSSFSVVCLTLFFVIATLLTIMYLSYRNVFLQYASNLKIVSITVLTLSMLLYFPIMNIYDLSTKSC